jgi:hypothetical protein
MQHFARWLRDRRLAVDRTYGTHMTGFATMRHMTDVLRLPESWAIAHIADPGDEAGGSGPGRSAAESLVRPSGGSALATSRLSFPIDLVRIAREPYLVR